MMTYDPSPFSFPSSEKLKSKKLIGKVFSEGFSVKCYPLRIQGYFFQNKDLPSSQMGVSVPKRNFKKAVDRNRIKRQIRECYRLQRSPLLDRLQHKDKQLALMIIYIGHDMPHIETIKSTMDKTLLKIKV